MCVKIAHKRWLRPGWPKSILGPHRDMIYEDAWFHALLPQRRLGLCLQMALLFMKYLYFLELRFKMTPILALVICCLRSRTFDIDPRFYNS